MLELPGSTLTKMKSCLGICRVYFANLLEVRGYRMSKHVRTTCSVGFLTLSKVRSRTHECQTVQIC